MRKPVRKRKSEYRYDSALLTYKGRAFHDGCVMCPFILAAKDAERTTLVGWVVGKICYSENTSMQVVFLHRSIILFLSVFVLLDFIHSNYS